MTDEDRLVQRIIKRHGEVIDLRERPDVIIDIVRQFGGGEVMGDLPDGGLPPGGVPPSPPPGPSGHDTVGPTINEVMKELKAVRKQLDQVKRQLDERGPG